jgi:integrase
MTQIRLQFVQAFIDRHGRVRYYFRRRGFKRAPLPGLPGNEEFMAAYRAALGAETAPRIEVGASRTIAGTVNAIVAAYLDCSPSSTSPFKTLAAETQRTRRNILEGFRLKHGDKRIFRPDGGRRVMLLTRERMQRIVNEKAATPFAQRNFLNTLRALFAWALGEGKVPDDPTLGVKRVKAKTSGYKTWSEADIERFESTYPIGTKARLAFALLLYTGQRRGDVVRMGPQHVHRGVLTVDQGKTDGGEEAHLEIPMHPRLREAIDAAPSGHLNFLVTAFGKPYTSNGFGKWFRELCDEAGCLNLSAHGLRKAAARRLAEIGCSAHEIAAITGHATLAEVQRYTKAADRKRLAQSAMKKLIESEGGMLTSGVKPWCSV